MNHYKLDVRSALHNSNYTGEHETQLKNKTQWSRGPGKERRDL